MAGAEALVFTDQLRYVCDDKVHLCVQLSSAAASCRARRVGCEHMLLYLVSTQARFDAAVEYFRKLGFMVQRIPFKQ